MGKKKEPGLGAFSVSVLTWQTPPMQTETNFWQRSQFQGNRGGPLSYWKAEGKSSVPRLLMSGIVGAKFPAELISD